MGVKLGLLPGNNVKGQLLPYSEQGDPDNDNALVFMFNPTEITESRSVEYNMSESQGQLLPYAQFGRVGKTEISFTLKFFNHNGLEKQLKQVRQLTLPKQVSRLSYYDQVSPRLYFLYLSDYGSFTGVITSLNIVTKQYHRQTLVPINMDVDVTFVETLHTLENGLNSISSNAFKY